MTAMQLTVAPTHEYFKTSLADQRGLYHDAMAKVIGADSRIDGRLLDVGCGAHGPTTPQYQAIVRRAKQLDGVDPTPGVMSNPMLTERWHGIFDDAPVPAGAYDAIVSFLVLEHVKDPQAFLRKAHASLKPGGVLYASTPHARHPFCAIVRFLDITGLKRFFADKDESINKIPSYYRLNSRGAVQRHAAAVGFKSAEVFFYPARWDDYWPRGLKWIARSYDWLLGYRFRSLSAQMLIKLEK